MEKLTKNQTYLSLSGEVLTPEDLKEIGKCLKLTVVWFQSCQVQDGTVLRKMKDEDMSCFANLLKIQDFSITNSDITDDGLKMLSNFPKLKFLNLDGSDITGSGFAALGKLERLEVIWLRHTRLSDQHLGYFELFPRLSTLLLYSTEVTREGFLSLAKLKHINVPKGGAFTDDDMLEFRKRQITLASGVSAVDEQTQTDVSGFISAFMNEITGIEQTLEKLDNGGAEDSLKIEQYQQFNHVFDRLCDVKAQRRYTSYGCSFQYYTYRDYAPLMLHQPAKSKIDAYYLADGHPVRFQLTKKNGNWKLLNRQQSINNKWTNVGL